MSPAPTPSAPGEDEGGTVKGRLLLQSGSKYKPVGGRILYLAKTIQDSGGVESVASLDRVESPRTRTDIEGRFAFSGVPQGHYGLVLDLVVQAYILLQPDQSATLLLDVVSGEELDLGDLKYLSLPPGALSP